MPRLDWSQTVELLTTAEVADQLRIPPATLRYWRHVGDIGPASFRLGRRVVYRRDVVEAWIAAQEAADPRTAPAA